MSKWMKKILFIKYIKMLCNLLLKLTERAQYLFEDWCSYEDIYEIIYNELYCELDEMVVRSVAERVVSDAKRSHG